MKIHVDTLKYCVCITIGICVFCSSCVYAEGGNCECEDDGYYREDLIPGCTKCVNCSRLTWLTSVESCVICCLFVVTTLPPTGTAENHTTSPSTPPTKGATSTPPTNTRAPRSEKKTGDIILGSIFGFVAVSLVAFSCFIIIKRYNSQHAHGDRQTRRHSHTPPLETVELPEPRTFASGNENMQQMPNAGNQRQDPQYAQEAPNNNVTQPNRSASRPTNLHVNVSAARESIISDASSPPASPLANQPLGNHDRNMNGTNTVEEGCLIDKPGDNLPLVVNKGVDSEDLGSQNDWKTEDKNASKNLDDIHRFQGIQESERSNGRRNDPNADFEMGTLDGDTAEQDNTTERNEEDADATIPDGKLKEEERYHNIQEDGSQTSDLNKN